MPLYFSYDPEGDGFMFHDTETEARSAAESALQDERDCAPEGWGENVELICWGEVKQRVKETECRPATEEDGMSSDIEIYADYDLLDASEGPASFSIDDGTVCFDARPITEVDDIAYEDDLLVRTHAACAQLTRYSEQVYSKDLLELLEVITDINDDLYHIRDKSFTIENCSKAKQLLDKITNNLENKGE